MMGRKMSWAKPVNVVFLNSSTVALVVRNGYRNQRKGKCAQFLLYFGLSQKTLDGPLGLGKCEVQVEGT